MSYWSQLCLPALKSWNVAEKNFLEKLGLLLTLEILALCMGLGVITHFSLTSIKP